MSAASAEPAPNARTATELMSNFFMTPPFILRSLLGTEWANYPTRLRNPVTRRQHWVRFNKPLISNGFSCVARMSEATSGADLPIGPACRYAHAGYKRLRVAPPP